MTIVTTILGGLMLLVVVFALQRPDVGSNSGIAVFFLIGGLFLLGYGLYTGFSRRVHIHNPKTGLRWKQDTMFGQTMYMDVYANHEPLLTDLTLTAPLNAPASIGTLYSRWTAHIQQAAAPEAEPSYYDAIKRYAKGRERDSLINADAVRLVTATLLSMAAKGTITFQTADHYRRNLLSLLRGGGKWTPVILIAAGPHADDIKPNGYVESRLHGILKLYSAADQPGLQLYTAVRSMYSVDDNAPFLKMINYVAKDAEKLGVLTSLQRKIRFAFLPGEPRLEADSRTISALFSAVDPALLSIIETEVHRAIESRVATGD
jgi:hypothetical protein